MPPKVDCLVLVAPSAAGKSTLLGRLMKDFPGRFGYSISHTTRGPRTGETPGESYHFIDEDRFKQMIANKEFLEHAVVHKTTYYGTSFASLRDVSARGQVATMDLDIQGAQSMRASSLRSCIVYIQTPSFEVLEQRLRARNTETEDKIQVRMASAVQEEEFFQANRSFFDIELMNDDLEECYAKFRREISRIVFGMEEEPKEEQKQDGAVAKSPDAAAAGGNKNNNNNKTTEQQTPSRASNDTVAASVGRSASGSEDDDMSVSKSKNAAAGAAAAAVNADENSKENQLPVMQNNVDAEDNSSNVVRPLVASLENGGAPRVRAREN